MSAYDQTDVIIKRSGRKVMVTGMMTCGVGIAVGENSVFVHHIPSGDTEAFIGKMKKTNIGAVQKIVLFINGTHALNLSSLKHDFESDVKLVHSEAEDAEVIYFTGDVLEVYDNGSYKFIYMKIMGK